LLTARLHVRRCGKPRQLPLWLANPKWPLTLWLANPKWLLILYTVTHDVYAHVCSCRQCWASKCRGL
jgi:hypothetical protein